MAEPETIQPPYVQFYPSDWKGGTAHLTPSLEWTYFQVCLHNWDKGKAMGRTLMPLMLGRNPNWETDIATLIEMDKLAVTTKDAVFVPRAMSVHRAAVRALEKKSRNGAKGAQKRWNNSGNDSSDKSDDGRNGDLVFSVPPKDWADFREHRGKLGAPMTDRAEREIIKRLEAIQREHGHDPVMVLEQSIRRGWKDVFPLKGDSNGPRAGGSRDGFFDALGD